MSPSLVTRPNKRNRAVISYVRFTEEVARKLDEIAEAEDTTRSAIIRRFVLEGFRVRCPKGKAA